MSGNQILNTLPSRVDSSKFMSVADTDRYITLLESPCLTRSEADNAPKICQ